MGCDILDGRIAPPGGTILRAGGWVLDHSISPCLLRGWLILKPERHIEHLAELRRTEAAALGPLIQKASRALMDGVDAERAYVMSMGEMVAHVHVHLVPRYPDMPKSGPMLLPMLFSDERPWACTDGEAADAVAAVRRQLRNAGSD